MKQSPTMPDSLQAPPDILLAVDPGKTNGVSIFRDGKVVSIDQVHLDDLPTFLYDFKNRYDSVVYDRIVIVYENFKLFKGKAIQQSGSNMEASQAIGQLKMIAAQNKWEIYDQPPSIKPIAQKWSGSKPPKNHSQSHQIDAYNHGVYWLIKNNMRRIEV